MKDPLTRLRDKTGALGNYNLKYLHIISEHIDGLVAALEREGLRDRVHLWNYSMDIPGEMDTVLEAASTPKEALDFLGCYYSLQFLMMNLRMVDIVKLDLAITLERDLISKKFMLEAGRMFRYLTKSYMQRLMNIFIGDKDCPDYVMLGVGTRSDQDDIDLGIVRGKNGDPEVLNRAISQLGAQMFKTATMLHFHLSEYVGGKSLTATIDEYEEVLDSNRYDFIIVNEMLGAANIIGSYPLYQEFRERVTDRFFYNPEERENRFHEGFLRGILGEIRAVLAMPKSSHSINPKEDGLRSIKGILSALKLVHGIDKVNAWEIIDALKEEDPWRKQQYESIEKTLSFFELFRHMYQVMVAQDEEIHIHDPSIEKMVAKIAGMIGYERKGVVPAEDFLMVYYYQYLDNCISAIDVLTGDLRMHLREVSLLKPFFSDDSRRRKKYGKNLALEFLKATSFARGITYWDDFLDELSDDRSGFYDEFVDSFEELSPRLKKKVGKGYVSGTRHDPAPILRFLTILGKKARHKNAEELFHFLCSLFIDELEKTPGIEDSISLVSVSYSGIMNNFLAILDYESLGRFLGILKDRPVLPRMRPYYLQLLTLAKTHYQSSHFFKRHFHPILDKYPIFIKNMYRNDKLKEITSGFYSDMTSLVPLDILYERIGDYYDMEFVRVSLLALAGASSEQTDAEFIEFCDNYTHSLHEFCTKEVHMSLGKSIYTHDLFALYAAGGHAREQGFDDDYDMIVILDSSDTEIRDICNSIVAKMNSHILRRGIFPHHRLAHHFGNYVISLDELADYLGGDSDDIFVDMTQILGARRLVGTSKLDRKLREKIIDPIIFARDREFVEYIVGETKMRHSDKNGVLRSNIKECPGGQRDIEMLLLVYKVRNRMREPLSRKLFARLLDVEPDKKSEFEFIIEHMNFIRNMRDLYRLKVAAHDEIEAEHLVPVADSMGYGDDYEAARRLYDDFIRRTEQASGKIYQLMEEAMKF